MCLRLCDQGLPPAIFTLKQKEDFTTFVFPHSLCFQATASVCVSTSPGGSSGEQREQEIIQRHTKRCKAKRETFSLEKPPKVRPKDNEMSTTRLRFHTRDLLCEFTVDHFCCTANRKNQIVFIVNKIKCSPCRVKRNSLNIITKESNKKES